jgi:C1A family cysteine protease
MHYVGGVYTNPNCSSSAETVNHAVLAVGWGEYAGVEYWIVKNSWSASWGGMIFILFLFFREWIF